MIVEADEQVPSFFVSACAVEADVFEVAGELLDNTFINLALSPKLENVVVAKIHIQLLV